MAVPLWLVVLIVLNSTMVMGFAQYYFLRQEIQKNLSELAKTTKSPEELVAVLKQQVLPQTGYKTSLKWKDLGKQLVEAGAIDRKKYEEIFVSDEGSSVILRRAFCASRVNERARMIINFLPDKDFLASNPTI